MTKIINLFKAGMTIEDAKKLSNDPSQKKATVSLFEQIDKMDNNKTGTLSKVDVQLYEKRILGNHTSQEKRTFDFGSKVAKYLIGYTSPEEQRYIKQNLKDLVNENNIEEFLNGYDSNNWIDALIVFDGDGIAVLGESGEDLCRFGAVGLADKDLGIV